MFPGNAREGHCSENTQQAASCRVSHWLRIGTDRRWSSRAATSSAPLAQSVIEDREIHADDFTVSPAHMARLGLRYGGADSLAGVQKGHKDWCDGGYRYVAKAASLSATNLGQLTAGKGPVTGLKPCGFALSKKGHPDLCCETRRQAPATARVSVARPRSPVFISCGGV